MSDLIRRQDAIDLVCRALHYNYEEGYAVTQMLTLPTIDAVEVVHCKDCKYRYKMACHKAEFYECSHIGLTSKTGKITHVGVTDDFFCADGEKKDEEEE